MESTPYAVPMLRRALALARSTHPGPTIAVTTVTVLLGIAVGLEPWRVAVLGIALAFDHLSIGLSNDAIDAERDRAVGRTDKPVAMGEISVRTVWVFAIGSLVVALAVTLALGIPATVAHTIALAAAWGYNAGLKNSAVSALSYAVGFGLLPVIASLALPTPAFPAWWAIVAGALLGIAAHFANVLPDLDDDRQTGIRGLPHRLGLPASIVTIWAALALGAGVVTVGVGSTPIALSGLAVSLAIAATGLVLALRRGVGRWLFRLVIAAALIDVAMLVLAGPRLLA